MCFDRTYYDNGICETEDVCYELYMRASPVDERKPSVNITKDMQYLKDLIKSIIIFDKDVLLTEKVFYHVDEYKDIDYFILHFIANSHWVYLQEWIDNEVFLQNETVKVFPQIGIFLNGNYEHADEYVVNIEPFNVTLNGEGNKLFVPSLNNENTMDVLDAVDQNSTLLGSCGLHVVKFNKIRICPYLEIPLQTYPFTINRDYLVLKTLANQRQEFKLFHWEYMIEGDRLRMCITDFYKLYSYLPNPEDTVASHLTGDVCHCYMYMVTLYVTFSCMIQNLMF